MLHAGINPEGRPDADLERRASGRSAFRGEVVVAWDHDLTQPIRLGVLDISDEGLRVSSALPILREMTGIAIALLPGDQALNRPFVVRWVESAANNGCRAGLEYLG